MLRSPVRQFFGHQPGAARQLIRWEKIVEYFEQIAKETDRIDLQNVGPSTEGNPFLVAYISAPENLARLEEYRQINLKLTDRADWNKPPSINWCRKARQLSSRR